MSLQTDPIVVALARLEEQVKTLVITQQADSKRLQWLTVVLLLVVGAVGGPEAVQAVTGGASP